MCRGRIVEAFTQKPKATSTSALDGPLGMVVAAILFPLRSPSLGQPNQAPDRCPVAGLSSPLPKGSKRWNQNKWEGVIPPSEGNRDVVFVDVIADYVDGTALDRNSR